MSLVFVFQTCSFKLVLLTLLNSSPRLYRCNTEIAEEFGSPGLGPGLWTCDCILIRSTKIRHTYASFSSWDPLSTSPGHWMCDYTLADGDGSPAHCRCFGFVSFALVGDILSTKQHMGACASVCMVWLGVPVQSLSLLLLFIFLYINNECSI